MKKMVLLVLILLLTGFVFGQEPIRFRGAYIGESLSDFVDCSSGKAKALKDGYKSHGKLCEKGMGSISRLKNRAILGVKEEGEVFGFNESKLIAIQIFVANEDWDQVRDDLTGKLGMPVKDIPQVYQNLFGARWEYGQGFWQSGEVLAFAHVKVAELGGRAINQPFTNNPETEGIEITITNLEVARHLRLLGPSRNTLD